MIHIHELGITYPGGVTGLHPTTSSFERGRFTILLGPSGAGKSSLLRCLNMLYTPTHGRIEVEGLGVLSGKGVALRHRRSTGMVFQQHQLIGRRTALQNVLVGRLGHHAWWRTLLPFGAYDIRLAGRCLERVGLAHKAMQRADQLSGGEQQRVGVARALAQEPRVLLADEPIASLDPSTARRVLSLLKAVCLEDGLCAVVSLHQTELALAFADRVVGLSHGHVVFDGSPGSVSQQVLTRIYDGADPDDDADINKPPVTDDRVSSVAIG